MIVVGIILIVCLFAVILYLKYPTNQCPARAEFGFIGTVVSEPGSKFFSSLDSYKQYYRYLANNGLQCSYVTPSGHEARDTVPANRTKEQEQEQGQEQSDPDSLTGDEQTYAKTPIKKLDDYEYTRIFSSERGSRNQLEKTVVNALTTQRQFDWSQLPFNSEKRTAQEQERAQTEGFTGTVTEPFFDSINGETIQPQDLQDLDERERSILQQYSPKKTEDFMDHDKDDVDVLVKKLFESDPDWEPILEKKNGNQFEVTGLKPKLRKEDTMFADEKVPSVAEAIQNGDATGRDVKIQPGMVNSGKQDPFFDKDGVIDYEGDHFYKYDKFAKWTPGLERMFAPTFDQNDWVHGDD